MSDPFTELTPAQAEGTACVVCATDFMTFPAPPAVPVGFSDRQGQVFACAGRCVVVCLNRAAAEGQHCVHCGEPATTIYDGRPLCETDRKTAERVDDLPAPSQPPREQPGGPGVAEVHLPGDDQ